jgi:hypothetical protein
MEEKKYNKKNEKNAKDPFETSPLLKPSSRAGGSYGIF